VTDGPLRVAQAQANAGPMTISDTDPIVLEGIYAYKYDARGRLIRKHVPGGGWEDIVYDKRDRPVLRRDGADGDNWRFTQYDKLGRVVRTGLLPTADDRATLQTAFDGLPREPWETYQWYASGEQHYTNTSFPDNYGYLIQARSATLYDIYDWQRQATFDFQPANAFGQARYQTTPDEKARNQGQVTGSLVRNLERDEWYKAVSYYDSKNRPIQGFTQSVRSTTANLADRTETEYRYNGEVLQVRSQRAGLAEQSQYSYDHLGRKLTLDHQFGGVSLRRVATYQYDPIGRLTQKRLGGTGTGGGTGGNVLNVPSGQTVTIPAGSTATHSQVRMLGGRLQMGNPSTLRFATGGSNALLQTLDYSWHIRGGLRGVNTNADGSLQTNKLFSMRLDYEQDGIYYTGDIRSQTWRSALDGQERSYVYEYDGLSRLTFANFTGPNGEDFDTKDMTYDANGNLLTMKRLPGIDNLTYTYPAYSNKLAKVSDATSNTVGFKDGTNPGDDYTYHDDGSLKSDANKGISLIEYNYLKLPRRITFGNGQVVGYEYDAAGAKLRKTVTNGSTTTTTDYVGNQVWENGVLYQASFEEGRIANTGTGTSPSYRYEWSLQDHLGNNRVSFAEQNGVASVVQSQHYDPWGWELPTLGTVGNPVNKFTFNNKEKQVETGWLDFKWRFSDPTLGRFWVIDRLAEKFYPLSTYQFASNNPITLVELDGLEGVRHDIVYKDAKGKEQTKTVVEMTVHVGVGKDGYTAEEAQTVISNLNSQYNRGFKVDGKKVEFNFNMETYNSDEKTVTDKAKEIRKETTVDALSPTSLNEKGDPLQVKAVTGYVLGKDASIPTSNPKLQGTTNVNGTRINPKADDIRHTEAHEIGHFMLNGNTVNPSTAQEHSSVGGIFQYRVVDEAGNTTQSTQNVNRSNVREIIRTMPIRKD
jgi:RHS repeat-associated protein